MNMTKYLSNPAIGRIMTIMCDGRNRTTKEIAEILSEIPAPTLYRHINALIEGGMIVVKEERKVRGSRERVLAVNHEWCTNLKLSEVAYPFFIDLFSRFERFEQEHQNVKSYDLLESERLLMGKVVICLDDDEMDGFIKEYDELITKYMKISEESKGKKGKLRDISLISAPTDFE